MNVYEEYEKPNVEIENSAVVGPTVSVFAVANALVWMNAAVWTAANVGLVANATVGFNTNINS